MAIKDSYPSIRPSLDLNFAGSRTVDPRITFSRASSATYFDEKGVMRTAPAGVPRIDHDPVTGECKGLLIEEQRTNLLTYSEDFSNATWGKNWSSISANAIIAPDGTLTAYKLVEDTNTKQHYIYQNPTLVNNAVYCNAVFAKAAERSHVIIMITDKSSVPYGRIFNLLDGTSTSTVGINDPGAYGITSVGNGWYFCWVAQSVGMGTTQNNSRILTSNGTTLGYTGDGTSGIYIWGAQLEAGSFPTSYIKTETSQVTRDADGSSITGVDFTNLFNPNEGTVVVEADYFGPNLVDSTTTGIVSLSDGATNFFSIIARTDTNSVRAAISPGSFLATASNSYPENTSKKIALAYKNNDFGLCLGGDTVYTNNTNQVNTNINSLIIGAYYMTTNRKLNGHIKRIAMYNRRVANANLQALTA